MTREQLLTNHQILCNAARELMKLKNADYAGKGADEPFANFTRCEDMGITTTEKGFLVRLTDKLSRLSSFADSGEFKVPDEKLEDTIIDIINYAVLLASYVKSKQEEKTA
jgi:hypothetical protein